MQKVLRRQAQIINQPPLKSLSPYGQEDFLMSSQARGAFNYKPIIKEVK